jgi:hypothetical protein
MSEQSEHSFRSSEQELEHLSAQLSEVTELLREIGNRVNQIERHVKRSFGIPQPGRGMRRKAERSADSSASDQPTISPEEVRPIFDELIRTWREESPQGAQARLQDMSFPDVKLIAHELGLSFSSKPSRKAVVSGIIGRMNESIMLSRNTNLTQPRSQSVPPESGSDPERES